MDVLDKWGAGKTLAQHPACRTILLLPPAPIPGEQDPPKKQDPSSLWQVDGDGEGRQSDALSRACSAWPLAALEGCPAQGGSAEQEPRMGSSEQLPCTDTEGWACRQGGTANRSRERSRYLAGNAYEVL